MTGQKVEKVDFQSWAQGYYRNATIYFWLSSVIYEL